MTQKALDLKNIKISFMRSGKLNLLKNYRGQIRENLPVSGEIQKFLFLCFFWVSVCIATALLMAFVFYQAVPYILEFIPDFLFFNINKNILINLSQVSAPVMTILGFIPTNAMFLVLLERKFLSLLTNRLGPNRVGYNGIFQTFCDALKLIVKEDTMPKFSDRLLFFLAPSLFFAPSIIAFLPILSLVSNGTGVFSQTVFPANLIFIFAVSSLGILGLVLAGTASHSKYSLLGSLRSVNQALSYEIPIILSLISFVLLTSSFELQDITRAQNSAGFFSWNILGGGALLDLIEYIKLFSVSFISGTFGVLLVTAKILVFWSLAFLIYTCSLAEVNRTPFDLPEAESELVSGFNTEYSGIKFALFFLAEYTNLFISSAVFAIMFLGSTNAGFDINFINKFLVNTFLGDLSWLTGTCILLFKTYILVVFAIWVRATLPRFKADQILIISWKYLIPISLLLILVSACLRVFSQNI